MPDTKEPTDAGFPVTLDVRVLFDRLPLALVMFDEAGRVQYANDRYLRRFGHAERVPEPLRRPPDPDGGWHALSIGRADGGDGELLAQTIRAGLSTVLVIDDSTEGDGTDVAGLRARIEELEKQGVTDHLTGAWNRAHFERIVVHELARSLRYHQPLSMILIDVDHFKSINDRFGHQAGDRVLRELVQILQVRVRASDMVFRWGGEEFAILLTGCGYRQARLLAERLRREIIRHEFDTGSVTVSMGVGESLADESLDNWFTRLDRLLYSAKEHGRDRVAVDERGNSDAWAAGGAQTLRFVWQEHYECGHQQIDREHAELFRRANELLEQFQSVDASPAAMAAAMDHLLEHVESHFEHEERVLAKLGYDHLAGHRRLHADLLASARALREGSEFDLGKASRALTFLARDVITGHLFGADRDFYYLFGPGGKRHPPAADITGRPV
jgi:diguanylate cyclase (GGDEF)-like protein/hemerythrin-like metal-binding protein